MHNVEFKSIKEIDLSKLERPQVAVYDSPEDYPKKAVAKIMDSGEGTNMVLVSDDLTELVKDIRENTTLTWYWRGPDDVPDLVGAFF